MQQKNSPNIWFTSDPHFGHKLMIRNYRTQFKNIDEHDNQLIRNWNSLVQPRDLVYCLGDVSFHDRRRTNEILYALNGEIYLIRGNHEKAAEHPECAKRFKWIRDIAYFPIQGQKIFLCHYAMRTWRSSHHGSWHLYGHSHGSLPEIPTSRSFDVGMDCWNLFPISFRQVAEKMKTKTFEPVDHHGRPHEGQEEDVDD